MTKWSVTDIPSQDGRVAVITGANTGIGFETARILAEKGAHVVLACRSAEKGQAAVERIEAMKLRGTASFAALDLSDLESVERFVTSFPHPRLDLLINNAGVMVPPLGRTKQGFELQIGTNHLGHFALTARLFARLAAAPGARVVVLSSGAQNFGHIDLTDLQWESRRYVPWRAYAQSKLANMMFALELDRRLRRAGLDLRVTAAHPGWTATDLQRTAPLTRVFNPIFGMRPADGALPTLRAATDPDAQSGAYFGPANFFEMNGPPVLAKIPRRAKDESVAKKLWDVSEQLVRVSFDLPVPAVRKVG
jgi:NAD(P)-dependent dehydrogenase (short-subunit alcohol dehydrogenase family)